MKDVEMILWRRVGNHSIISGTPGKKISASNTEEVEITLYRSTRMFEHSGRLIEQC